jgi:ABC-2 type transport system permease protein
MSATTTTPAAETNGSGPVHLSEAALRAALASGERPARPSPAQTALTFAWRGMLKIKHVPEQLFDVTLTPVMFTLMFTYLFGGAIAGSTGDYLQFLLPGILALTVIFTTVYTGTAINTDVTKGVVDRFRSLPIWQAAPLVGPLLSDTLRYGIAAGVTLLLGLILGYDFEGGIAGTLGAVGLLLVFAFALSWLFALVGLLLRSPQAVMNVSFTAIFPLTFASNTFVDPETMPAGVEAFVDVNPITHLVTAVRGLMEGNAAGGDIVTVLIWALAITAVFAPLTAWRYRTREG